MKNFDTRVYSVSDFLEWDSNGLLELNPDFQRRSVWSEKAKSYLIDTVIRGLPMPKIIISQKLAGSRNIRVVVDGQQRLRAILDFINGDFKILRVHNEDFAGYFYDMLPNQQKENILKYELGVDLIFNIAYEEVLDIFQRLNSYTVTLTPQEKLNSKYLGYFKKYVFDYGRKYVNYFIEGGILTKVKVARMAEAELATDLFVALIGGIQTNKNNENYYRKYEDDDNNLVMIAEQFDSVMSYIGEIYPPEVLALTNWSRNHLFYTLFTVIAHFLFGVKGVPPELRAKISNKSIGRLRVRLDEISSRYDEVAANIEDENYPADYKHFIDFSRRRTTDTTARIERTIFVCKKLKEVIE